MSYTIVTQNIKHVVTLSLLSLVALFGAVFAAPKCFAFDAVSYQPDTSSWGANNTISFCQSHIDNLNSQPQFGSLSISNVYIFEYLASNDPDLYYICMIVPKHSDYVPEVCIFQSGTAVRFGIKGSNTNDADFLMYIGGVMYYRNEWIIDTPWQYLSNDIFTYDNEDYCLLPVSGNFSNGFVSSSPPAWCNFRGNIFIDNTYGYNYPNYAFTPVTPLAFDGSISPSSVNSYSDIDLFSGFYDITFEPLAASNDSAAAQKFLNNSYPCYLTGVLSDNGYNMASIQCPALSESVDTCFYGIVSFNKSKGSDYSFDDFTLSFTTDLPSDADVIAPDADEYPLLKRYDGGSFVEYDNLVTMTVNSMRFMNNANKTVSYSMRELSSIDYRASSSSYDGFVFYCSINSNIYSSGSFIYNFTYSDVKNNGTSLDEQDKEDLGEEGKKKNGKTKKDYAYVPRYNTYNALDDGFDWNDTGNYDFTPVSDLLGWFFNNSFILALVTACCVVGLVGYVLYGKRG